VMVRIRREGTGRGETKQYIHGGNIWN